MGGEARTSPGGAVRAATGRDIELWSSMLLLAAVVASAVIMGGALGWSGASGEAADGLTNLGLLLLLLTPLIRVAAYGIMFLVERDYLYVGMSGLILGILVVSFVWGAAI